MADRRTAVAEGGDQRITLTRMVLSDEEANFLTTMEASAPTQSQAKILMTADLLQALASKVTIPETAPITQADVLWICGAGHRRRYRKRPSWDDAITSERTYGSTSYTRVAKDWLPDESSELHHRVFISNVSKPKATARYFWRLLRCSHSARVMAVEGEARGHVGRRGRWQASGRGGVVAFCLFRIRTKPATNAPARRARPLSLGARAVQGRTRGDGEIAKPRLRASS